MKVSQEAIDNFNRDPQKAVEDLANQTSRFMSAAFAFGVFIGFVAGGLLGKFVL